MEGEQEKSRRERGRRVDFDKMEEEKDTERMSKRERGVDFDKTEENNKEDKERINRRERGRRVDEKPVAELARARTAGSPIKWHPW